LHKKKNVDQNIYFLHTMYLIVVSEETTTDVLVDTIKYMVQLYTNQYFLSTI